MKLARNTMAVAAVAAVAIAAQAEAGMGVPSEVTFKQSKIRPEKFKGRVISPEDNCEINRKVKIFRVEPGPNQKVTKTFTSGATGKYRVIIPMQAGNKLFAVIEGYDAPNGVHCANDRSPKVLAD